MKLLINKYFKLIPFLIIIVLCLTPVIWFLGKGDVLINGVDTNFPLNPLLWFSRRLFIWNNISNAGSDFSSSTAGLFFHFVQLLPYSLNLNLQFVEIFSLVFWFSSVILSAYFFARTLFPKKPIQQLIFVTIYSFNTYIFNTWENVKVANLSLLAGTPLVLGLITQIYQNIFIYKKAIFITVIAALLLTGSGINPAYFICFLLIFLIYLAGFLVASDRKKEVLLKSSLVLLLIILINLFWIIPTISFLFKNITSTGSIGEIGFNNWVDSLSENTNIFNVMRLQGAWDWYAIDSVTGFPIYIPYALNYFYRIPFIIFSLVIPILAFLSVIFRKKEFSIYYLIFSLMFIIGLFLGIGTHPPTGYLYKIMLNNIPFFSFFRSPWYIFTPILIIAYAGLISILFDYLYDKFNSYLIHLFAMIFIIGNFVYCYPLVTGKIFRPQRNDSFYVSFPDYVFKSGEWLNSQKLKGRILNFPDDEIESFNWKYRGIESILQLISNSETIYLSLNATNSPVANLTKQAYVFLRKGQIESFLSISSKLNLEYIFEKNDQISLSPPLPNVVKEKFDIQKFNLWNFYKIPDNNFMPKIYTASNIYSSYPYSESVFGLPILKKTEILVNPEDNVFRNINSITSISGIIINAKNIQTNDLNNFINTPSNLTNRLVSKDLSKGYFEFSIPEQGFYQIALENYKLNEYGIDISKDIQVMVNDNPVLLKIDKISDSYIFFKSMEFKKDDYRLIFFLENKNLVKGGNFEDGEKFIKGGYGDGNVRFQIEEEKNNKYLNLLNLNKAEQSADFSVDKFDHMISYYIKFKYRQVYGNNGLIVVSQQTPKTLIKAQTERLPNYPEWQNFSFYFDPVKTVSGMKLSLVAPFTHDALGTKILYDDLEVYKVFSNKLTLLKEGNEFVSSPKIIFEKISPVKYIGEVQESSGSDLIVFSENYSPDWQIKLYDIAGNDLPIISKHFTANLFANAWYMDNTPSKYKFKIYYRNQDIYNISLAVSSSVLIGSLLIIIFRKR